MTHYGFSISGLLAVRPQRVSQLALPGQDRTEAGGGAVCDRELVMTGGQVSPLMRVNVEFGGSATAGAPACAGGDRVALFKD